MSEGKARILSHIAIPIKIPNSNKSQWTRVGVIVQSANGKRFGKINFIPTAGWDGGFALFEDDRKGAAQEFPEQELDEPPAELP